MRTCCPGCSSREWWTSKSASFATRGSDMSILISQTRPLESGQNGRVLRAFDRPREDRLAGRVGLGAECDLHAVGAFAQLRELEEQVARRLAAPVGAGQPPGARGPRDLHFVREA